MSIFAVKTSLTKSDYHKFLYITSFFKNPDRILLTFCYSAICAALLSFSNGSGIAVTAGLAVVLFLLLMLLRCAGIERKYSVRISTDKTGLLDSVTEIEFFDSEMAVRSESPKTVSTIEYDRIYRLYESRDYLMFYCNAGQASVIRKVDVENVGALTAFLREKFGERYKTIAFEL